MRELVARYLSRPMSRRRFVSGLTKAGLTATAANAVLDSVTSVAFAQQGSGAATAPVPYLPSETARPAASVTAAAWGDPPTKLAPEPSANVTVVPCTGWPAASRTTASSGCG